MTRVAGMLKPIINGDFPSLRKKNISTKSQYSSCQKALPEI